MCGILKNLYAYKCNNATKIISCFITDVNSVFDGCNTKCVNDLIEVYYVMRIHQTEFALFYFFFRFYFERIDTSDYLQEKCNCIFIHGRNLI